MRVSDGVGIEQRRNHHCVEVGGEVAAFWDWTRGNWHVDTARGLLEGSDNLVIEGSAVINKNQVYLSRVYCLTQTMTAV